MAGTKTKVFVYYTGGTVGMVPGPSVNTKVPTIPPAKPAFQALLRPPQETPPCAKKLMCSDVRLLRDSSPGSRRPSVLAGDGGVNLETYGNENAPDDDWFINTLKAATTRGVLILNCTQVYKGSVRPIYKAGVGLRDAGVLSGFEITPEAALTKMLWCLHDFEKPEDRKKIIKENICGEMTVIE